ncbi:MAG: VOC family protein [Lachnospiraceae bacterium]|nr:VOC family protein [Lachnospiraceae bacterium]
MQKLKFHHIGIATEDIALSQKEIENHFSVASVSDTVFDQNQNAYLCMITLDDGYRMELVQGEVVRTLVKRQRYLYHTCYTVEDIDEAIGELLEEGYFQISEPKEAVLFHNRKVAFLSGKLGMIELLQSDSAIAKP